MAASQPGTRSTAQQTAASAEPQALFDGA